MLYNACVMPRLKIICFLLIKLVSSVTLICVHGWWHTFTFSFAKTLHCILERNNLICMYYFFNSVMDMPLKVLNKVWRVHTLHVSDITILTTNSFQNKAKLYKHYAIFLSFRLLLTVTHESDMSCIFYRILFCCTTLLIW